MDISYKLFIFYIKISKYFKILGGPWHPLALYGVRPCSRVPSVQSPPRLTPHVRGLNIPSVPWVPQQDKLPPPKQREMTQKP